jgi:hypothetical protein
VVLGMVTIAVTVSGTYVLLVLDTFLTHHPGATGYDDAQVRVLRHVLLVWTVVLLGLAAVNAIVVTWVTVLDNRHTSALARALGATPGEVSAALAAAQVLPRSPAPCWVSSRAASGCSPPSWWSPAATATGPRCPRSGGSSRWCWRSCWWWRRSPRSRPASAAAARLRRPCDGDPVTETL